MAIALRSNHGAPSGGFSPHARFANVFAEGEPVKMEPTGFEPVTPCLQSRCSTS